jgi:hypothetical protein
MADAEQPLSDAAAGEPHDVGSAAPAEQLPGDAAPAGKTRKRSIGSWAWKRVRRAGGNVLGFALGRLLELPPEPPPAEPGTTSAGQASPTTTRRVGMLHNVAEQLNQQLVQMRDQELQFRLRLLRYTLIFTVLVALLSLLYKWASRWLT